MGTNSIQIWGFRFISFFASFLLFQIEFIIGKIFLPNFGGSYLVWGSCIVFFQATLLLGYLYAHLMVTRVGIVKYRFIHLGVMVLPFLFFPGRALPMAFGLNDLPLVVEVFWKLTVFIGPVFFLLSTMSLILQAWLTQSRLPEKDNPYTLFAVSNLGSFAALFTYPFFFELYYDLNVQQTIWRICYVILFVSMILAYRFIPVDQETTHEEVSGKTTKNEIMQWLFFGAAGVVLFLAVTNIITAEIAPVPLLWMLPLSIYLLSFVLNFKKTPWCPKWIVSKIHFIIGYTTLSYFFMISHYWHKFFDLINLLIVLFFLSMYCQKQLYEKRPVSNRLTLFYVYISLGSFFGGVIATWIIPLLSTTFTEYFWGLLFLSLASSLSSKKRPFTVASTVAILLLLSWLFLGSNLVLLNKTFGVVCGLILVISLFSILRKSRYAITTALLLVIFLVNQIEARWANKTYLLSDRNYYGLNRIYEKKGIRYYLQGSTVHGAQFLDPKTSHIPLTYYNLKSPPSQLLQKENFKDVAVVGLGTGTLAVYAKPQQNFDIFELDPDVLKIAQEQFSYLSLAKGNMKYIIGDARISLEKNKSKKYDLIIVDAFSGDSIPIHLLTTEAIQMFKRHLKEKGLLILHLTNRYVQLRDPIFSIAYENNAFIAYNADVDYIHNKYISNWVAITWDLDSYKKLESKYKWFLIDPQKINRVRIWTDTFSNIIPYLQYSNM